MKGGIVWDAGTDARGEASPSHMSLACSSRNADCHFCFPGLLPFWLVFFFVFNFAYYYYFFYSTVWAWLPCVLKFPLLSPPECLTSLTTDQWVERRLSQTSEELNVLLCFVVCDFELCFPELLLAREEPGCQEVGQDRFLPQGPSRLCCL